MTSPMTGRGYNSYIRMTDRQDATRTRLLDATLGVLVSHGASRATSREIASAAGVNLQAITYHFGSKDELVAQALVHAVRRWVEPARAALAGVGQDPVGHLLAAVLALQKSLDDARGVFPAYVEALAAAPRNEAVRAEIVGLLRDLRDGLALSIRELRDAGMVAGWVDPQSFAALVVAAGDGFVLHSMLDPEGYAVDRTLGQVVQLLLAARTSTAVALRSTPATGAAASTAADAVHPGGGRDAADRDAADRDAADDGSGNTASPDEAVPRAGRAKAVVRRSALDRPPQRPRGTPATGTPDEEGP
jgi:AcrR family transcriptional regulator